jgi:hypothetical protein
VEILALEEKQAVLPRQALPGADLLPDRDEPPVLQQQRAFFDDRHAILPVDQADRSV